MRILLKMATNEILAERGTTHGDFTTNAQVSQEIKKILAGSAGWQLLSDVQKESLHMIALKISRIVSGNPSVKDHWDDICGYATLAAKEIQ